MTFRQFGIEEPFSFEGGIRPFCIECLQETSDEKLAAVARHYGFAVGEYSAPLGELPWEPGLFRLFVSHYSEDKVTASELKDKIWKRAVTGFVAHADINPTDQWRHTIERALSSCDALVVLLTKTDRASAWVDQEIGWALGRDTLVVPVALGALPRGFLEKHQALAARPDAMSDLASELSALFFRHERTAPAMTRAAIRWLGMAESWETARARVHLLSHIKVVSKQDAKDLRSLLDEKEKVREGFGIPDRINALLRKFGHEIWEESPF